METGKKTKKTNSNLVQTETWFAYRSTFGLVSIGRFENVARRTHFLEIFESISKLGCVCVGTFRGTPTSTQMLCKATGLLLWNRNSREIYDDQSTITNHNLLSNDAEFYLNIFKMKSHSSEMKLPNCMHSMLRCGHGSNVIGIFDKLSLWTLTWAICEMQVSCCFIGNSNTFENGNLWKIEILGVLSVSPFIRSFQCMMLNLRIYSKFEHFHYFQSIQMKLKTERRSKWSRTMIVCAQEIESKCWMAGSTLTCYFIHGIIFYAELFKALIAMVMSYWLGS